MRKITLSDRLRYQFDNTMARGPVAVIGWLLLLSVALITLIALIVAVTGIGPAGPDGQPLGFWSAEWAGLMRAMDSGAIGGDDPANLPFLAAMFVATIGGIFIVSTLIGLLTSGIESRLEDLRKGRSFVIEQGHTVILGWSPQVFAIIGQLVAASANQRRSCIVILAEQDKVEMEDAIRDRVGPTGRTRVVCRTGSPADLNDLEIVNPQAARAIIVLGGAGDSPDSQVIKTILALVHSPRRRPAPYHIVAELRDPKNLPVARMIGRDEVQIVPTGELIARITVQTCRQSGLSVIYTELLDFGGDEIYFRAEPGLVGRTFGEALLAYEDSAVIGVCFSDGRVRLRPPMDTRIAAGDALIALSEDDNTIHLSGLASPPVDSAALRDAPARASEPERTLILGWNRRGLTIINELDSYVAPGSHISVVAEHPDAEELVARDCAELRNQQISFRAGDTTDRRTLDELGIPAYQHVIVLSYSDLLAEQEADSRTLVTLLHLRDIARQADASFSIVSEMLDIRNRELAEVTKADDFIVSDRLVSLMLSQIAEKKELAAVFADLFDPSGAEIYLKPIGDYVALGQPITFYTLVEAARRRGEVAIGYRQRALAADAARAYGVRLNPDKSQPVAFAEGDRLIVLAEA